ncbi:hypothetical protein DFP72DRAFT_1074747 [Ephemerocybe angulata]|uniref:Uncharacterized protein n=1 Tax=Ephemerocybe angulata TaxID=980116 RepID=A0A8H6LXV6_9AGAR|nr:hypothetical protein DFP72DRAFT_1074747 [Tulosesus angulatus]
MADPPGRHAWSSPPRSDSGASTAVSTGSQHPSRPSSRLSGLQPSSRTQSVTRETYHTTVPALCTLPTSESSEQGAGSEVRGRQPHSTSHPASVSGRSTPRNPAAFAQLAMQQQEAGYALPLPPARPLQDADHQMASQSSPSSRYSFMAPEDGPPPTQEFFCTTAPPSDAALIQVGPPPLTYQFQEDKDQIHHFVPLSPPGPPANPDTCHPPSPNWARQEDYMFSPLYEPARDSALSGGRGFQQHHIQPQQCTLQQGQASRGPQSLPNLFPDPG